ncbi:unnamed protein product [Moneuplotes crassus]|uniref:Chromo domain-containing protein n=1 Tax=Euplotes crassus TaxID=5936 RepID=A0AAD1U527_EUPCR|nr:unnamed protein product [Moneuplotes crassus]
MKPNKLEKKATSKMTKKPCSKNYLSPESVKDFDKQDQHCDTSGSCKYDNTPGEDEEYCLDKYYEVEKILKCSEINGELKYLVKWEGYSMSECTWEPISSFENNMDLIDEFNKSLNKIDLSESKYKNVNCKRRKDKICNYLKPKNCSHLPSPTQSQSSKIRAKSSPKRLQKFDPIPEPEIHEIKDDTEKTNYSVFNMLDDKSSPSDLDIFGGKDSVKSKKAIWQHQEDNISPEKLLDYGFNGQQEYGGIFGGYGGIFGEFYGFQKIKSPTRKEDKCNPAIKKPLTLPIVSQKKKRDASQGKKKHNFLTKVFDSSENLEGNLNNKNLANSKKEKKEKKALKKLINPSRAIFITKRRKRTHSVYSKRSKQPKKSKKPREMPIQKIFELERVHRKKRPSSKGSEGLNITSTKECSKATFNYPSTNASYIPEEKVVGSLKTDEPQKILNMKISEAMRGLVEWKKRPGGTKPQKSYCSMEELKEMYPRLVCDFYEGKVIQKRLSKNRKI